MTEMKATKIDRMLESAPVSRSFCFLLLTMSILVLSSCGPNENILKSGRESSPETKPASRTTTLEEDLEAMRTADFSFIYVLRRKDGSEMDAEDRSVIKQNTMEANRRVSSDNDRAIIIGTNTPIRPKNMAAVYERFAVENFSPQPAATAANSNGAR